MIYFDWEKEIMKTKPNIIMIFIVTALFLQTYSYAADVSVDFEQFQSMNSPTYPHGSTIFEYAKLYDQLLDIYGVIFTSGSSYVAVRDWDHCTPSGFRYISGSTPDGKITVLNDYPIIVSFFEPGNLSVPYCTDFVSIRADTCGSGAEITLYAYDIDGELIVSDTKTDSGGPVLEVSTPDKTIHYVEFCSPASDITEGGVGFDDLRFNTPGLPEGLPGVLSLYLEGGTDYLFRDLVVSWFDISSSATLESIAVNGTEVTDYIIPCGNCSIFLPGFCTMKDNQYTIEVILREGQNLLNYQNTINIKSTVEDYFNWYQDNYSYLKFLAEALEFTWPKELDFLNVGVYLKDILTAVHNGDNVGFVLLQGEGLAWGFLGLGPVMSLLDDTHEFYILKPMSELDWLSKEEFEAAEKLGFFGGLHMMVWGIFKELGSLKYIDPFSGESWINLDFPKITGPANVCNNLKLLARQILIETGKFVEGISFWKWSPVNMEIVDPCGLTLSEKYSEIPYSIYLEFESCETYFILFPLEGEYKIHVTPKKDALPTDVYSISARSSDFEMELANHTLVSEIPAQGYSVIKILPPSMFDPNNPNTLLIQNFVKQFYNDPNEPHANQGLLIYIEKSGNFNGVDVNDVLYTAPEQGSSKIVSKIARKNLHGEVTGHDELSKDVRPFPSDANDPNSNALLELSIYSPELNGTNINSENYLKFWLAENAFEGKPLTIQQVSSDPDVEYPLWDIRNIIRKNNRRLPLSDLTDQRPNIVYVNFTLSTNRVIEDINGDNVVDLIDYDLIVRDFGKQGIYRSDIAGPKGTGLPDGIVDELDGNAFYRKYIELNPDKSIVNPYAFKEDFETGDYNRFNWELSGDEDWIVSTTQRNSGSLSAQAGLIGNNQKSTLKVTLDCLDGHISFYYRVSCEDTHDKLEFFIDGDKQSDWSGDKDWAHVSFPVTAGTRTFEWSYTKDGSVSVGDDTVWIDDIEFLLN